MHLILYLTVFNRLFSLPSVHFVSLERIGNCVDVTAGFFDVDAELKVSAGRLLIHLVQLVVVRHNLESACG